MSCPRWSRTPPGPSSTQLQPEFDRCTGNQLRERVRELILAVDPDAVKERTRKTAEHRFVEHTEYANGTSALCGMYLDKDRAAAAWDHVDAIANATKAGGDPLERDIAQIRADVFVDLLAGVDPTLAGAATPAPRKGVVYLHINTTTLACLDDHPGTIEGFGPVIADMARQTVAQMAERAQWRFVVEDDDGQTVAEGRLKYRPTLAQTMFVNARDNTCRAPGCRRPARRCDHDHVRDYAVQPRHDHREPVLSVPAASSGQTRRADSRSAAPNTASTGPPPAAPPTPSSPKTATHPPEASRS